MTQTNHKKRNIALIGVALAMCFLMVTAQPAQSFVFIPLLVFALATIAGYAAAWLVDNWQGAPAGVTADSALSLFYNSKNNEFMSLTVGVHDEASSVNATGYYMGRKAEYATMNFLNNTIYPTYPKWQIFNYSSSNMNQSVNSELGNTFTAWLQNYDSAIQDAQRYAHQSFSGALAGLDLKFGSTSVKSDATDDFILIYGKTIHSPGAGSGWHNSSLGYAIVPDGSTNTIASYWKFDTGQVNTYLDFKIFCEDQLTGNNTEIDFINGVSDTYESYILTPGVYNLTLNYADVTNMAFYCGVYTDALLVDSSATFDLKILSPSMSVAFSPSMNFIDTQATTYTIDLTNLTQCDPMAIRLSLDLTQNFANSLANAYWTTLRNAGIYDISEIPPNQVIPLPDFAFLTNTDLALLNAQEIQAMYLAYLKALGNFFNSTTYTNIVNFNTANVTFNNIGVIVNATASRNGTIYTEGDLYIQVYDDMDLVIGLNTLNSSGLLYNLNDTTCWSYAAGDVLNISHIYVRNSINDSYVEVTNATIRALTIDAYLYTSNSGSGLVPTGGGAGGSGGSGGALLIIAILVILALATRGSASNNAPNINIKRQIPRPRTPFKP